MAEFAELQRRPAPGAAPREAQSLARALSRAPGTRSTTVAQARARPDAFPGVGVVQRVGCGTPGCTDPNCTDPKKHKFGNVHELREGTVYNWTVTPDDVGTGTDTSQETRDNVNQPGNEPPRQVAMSYSSTGGQSGSTEFINQQPQSGERYDAGHIRSNQTGGLGNDTVAVFPQNAQQNEGHKLGGQSTYQDWRGPESNILNQAKQGESVDVSVTLRPEERQTYDQTATTYTEDPHGKKDKQVAEWFKKAESEKKNKKDSEEDDNDG